MYNLFYFHKLILFSDWIFCLSWVELSWSDEWKHRHVQIAIFGHLQLFHCSTEFSLSVFESSFDSLSIHNLSWADASASNSPVEGSSSPASSKFFLGLRDPLDFLVLSKEINWQPQITSDERAVQVFLLEPWKYDQHGLCWIIATDTVGQCALNKHIKFVCHR